MKNYTKTYLKYFNLDESDFIACEVCGAKAVDIHHIERKGMGGSKTKDNIENIMALCRRDHERYGDKKEWKDWLKKIHQIKLCK